MVDMLNTSQRSSLTLGLRAFEMHLRQADAWLQSGEEHGILYRRRLGLTPECRAAARAQIAAALAQVTALTERFGLTPAEDDLAATIGAQMSVDWANLCDLRSDKLRRYGDVDSRLADLLDSDIVRLAEAALTLASVMKRDVPTA